MTIKVYQNTDAGAPSLTGQAGSLIDLLDAVLVNGYNEIGVTSITRVSGTATVTTSAPHGFKTGDSAVIYGAEEQDYNTESKVHVIDSTTFTYGVSNEPDTPATGSIFMKRAPAGFGKPLSGINKAAYRSDNIYSNRHYLFVKDDASGAGGATEANVYGYEEMTDIDSGDMVFPSVSQSILGYLWKKSSTSNSIARAWMIISDGKSIYYFCSYAKDVSSNNIPVGDDVVHTGFFGDTISYKQGDAFSTMITGTTSANQTSRVPSGLFCQSQSISSPTTINGSVCLARDFTGAAGAKLCYLRGTGMAINIGYSTYLPYPNPTDNGFYIVPIVIVQNNSMAIRGRLPGAYEQMHGRIFEHGTTITNIQGMPDRKLMMVHGQSDSNSASMMIDITGPWDS